MAGVDVKGRELLHRVNYDLFRQAFIESLMRKISTQGGGGRELRTLIEETLDEEEFRALMQRLVESIDSETRMGQKDSKTAASLMLEEDVGDDLSRHMQGEIHEQQTNGEPIYRKGEESDLWHPTIIKRVVGIKPRFLSEVHQTLRRHTAIQYTLALGLVLITTSAALFGSAYKAVVVGLTLTAFEGGPTTKLANIAAGFGGVLIFFITVTLLLQYLIAIQTREEHIKQVAADYLRQCEKEKSGDGQ